MTRVIRQLALAATILLCALGWAQAASAATGYVNGVARYWNKNGNYCPTGADCTGSLYPQSQYDTWKSVPNAIVRIYDGAGAQLGQGSTDWSGAFTVSWTAAVMPAQFRLRFFPIQKDVRFWIAQTDGSLYNVYTGLYTTTASSAGSPQWAGIVSIGGTAAPDPFFNAYWAGEREWRYVFDLVGLLQANFTGLEIRGFANTIASFRGTCDTSCAAGEDNQVQLDGDAGLRAQARIMHEMGHIASYNLKPWQRTTDYSWAGSPPPIGYDATGWNEGSYEWGMTSFEEAFATHGGNIAFWGPTAVVPTTCNTTEHCYQGAGPLVPIANADVEATSYPFAVNNCVVGATLPEARQPISTMRFLWDVYDSRNDCDGDEHSAATSCFWCQFGVIGYYGSGTTDYEIDGPWNAARTSLDNKDARASTAYVVNYQANFASISLLRTDNCSPP